MSLSFIRLKEWRRGAPCQVMLYAATRFFDIVMRTRNDARGDHFTDAFCRLHAGVNGRIDRTDVAFTIAVTSPEPTFS